MALTCELCGSTDFLKTDGVFVCQKCGCKYSPEDAKRMMAAAAPAPAQPASVTVIVNQAPARPEAKPAQAPGTLPRLNAAGDFRTQNVNVAELGAREANNYVCQGFQLLYQQYQGTQNPQQAQYEKLRARALECLQLLDAAAMLEPDKHVQNSIIYTNCTEIEDGIDRLHYYEKKDDGTFSSKMPMGYGKLVPAGQRDSWDAKRDYHKKFLEQEYIDAHAAEWGQRSALEAEASRISEQLGDLKEEKRGHGLFDFAGKREVKERMEPVKQQLREVQAQIRTYDDACAAYVRDRIAELAVNFVQLSF